MYLENLRTRLTKLAAKAPAVAKVPKTPKTPSVSTSMPSVSIGKTPNIKMPSVKPPAAPKLPTPSFPTPESTLKSVSAPDIFQSALMPMQDFMDNLFNNNAAKLPK